MTTASTLPRAGASERTRGHNVRAVLAALWRYVRIPLIVGMGLCAAFITVLLVAVLAFPYPIETLDAQLGGPLVVTDRNGNVLRTVPGAEGRPGRQNWVALDNIPSTVLVTVLASEDDSFYDHAGVDGWGLVRAAWLNLRSRRVLYGGSTVTMQLARMLHSAGRPRSLVNKIREMIWALRLERAVDKRTILEHYLNRAYYGNGAYGIEAAARLYFGKSAVALSLGEATFLAILPRAPTAYDPLKHHDRALRRRDYVLAMLERQGLISSTTAGRARGQTITVSLHAPPFHAPHFVDWVISGLPDDVRERGGVVETTLDLPLQQALEHRTAEHVAGLNRRNVNQAGVVVLDTSSGEILAMVGSAGYDGKDGQVNIVTRRRHPGSALKPFVYALAIEGGDNPATIAYDLYDDVEDYTVVNKSQPEHGPVRYREALAGSYNMAAVDVLDRVGVSRLMSLLRQAGVGPLDGHPDDYGLRLALGSAQVRLLDLAAGYGFLVRGGKVIAPTAITQVARDDGSAWRPDRPLERRVTSPETSWMVMDMLADPEPRHQVFGHELPVDLPYPVAVKTGTARGFADTVAVAITREVTVAAWAGNFDGTPTQGMVAMRSAAPLVRAGLLLYTGQFTGGRDLTLPARPAAVESGLVCPLSGKRPSVHCPHQKHEYFLRGHAPTGTCDWHRERDGETIIVYPARARAWAERTRTRAWRDEPASDE